MMRYVVCKSGNGKVISDGHCDRELKPLTVQPCGAPDCPAHWVEQEWEQVDVIICITSCDGSLMQTQHHDVYIATATYCECGSTHVKNHIEPATKITQEPETIMEYKSFQSALVCRVESSISF